MPECVGECVGGCVGGYLIYELCVGGFLKIACK